MPVTGLRQAADGVVAPWTVDYAPPARQVHDHGFVGVDYPLDTVAKRDPQKGKRAALLASAAQFSVDGVKVDGANLTLKFGIENRTGHKLTTGLAFARERWIEVNVKDG